MKFILSVSIVLCTGVLFSLIATPLAAQTDFAMEPIVSCFGPGFVQNGDCANDSRRDITLERSASFLLGGQLTFSGAADVGRPAIRVTFPSNIRYEGTKGADHSGPSTRMTCSGAAFGARGGEVECTFTGYYTPSPAYIPDYLVFSMTSGKSATLTVTATVPGDVNPSNNTAAVTASRPVVVVPVVGHLQGGFGSVFRSDLKLHNRSGEAVSGEIILTPWNATGAAEARVPFTVQPYSVLFFEDVYAVGYPGGSGAARLTIDAADNYDRLVVDSATYTLVSGGGELGNTPTVFTTAQVTDFADPYEGATRYVVLGKERERTNVFIMTGAKGATVEWQYRDASGGTVSPSSKVVTYAPNATYQVSAEALLGFAPAANSSLRATIKDGSGWLSISPVNNVSNQGRWIDFR